MTIKKIESYGVEMTELEAMRFDKWMSNNDHPAMNTLVPEERKALAQKVLKIVQDKDKR